LNRIRAERAFFVAGPSLPADLRLVKRLTLVFF